MLADRYLLRSFLKLFGIILAACLGIFILGDFTGNLAKFVNAKLPDIGRYYLYYTPYVLTIICPVALLLSTMFTLGLMAKHSELVALRSAGVSLFRTSLPLLAVGILCAGGMWLASEHIVPAANEKKKELEDVTLFHYRTRTGSYISNLYFRGREGVIYYFSSFDMENKTGHDPLVQVISPQNTVTRLIQARRLAYRDSAWRFYDGWDRTTGPAAITAVPFVEEPGLPQMVEVPEDLVQVRKKPEEMTFAQLQKYIENVQRSGGRINTYLADLYFKFSNPFINFVVVLLGVAITGGTRRKNLAMIFGIGLFTAFAYFVAIRFGLALSHSGKLPPLAGAWFGNFIFLPLALFFFLRSNR
jgi:lipopolysaccharide export system permease protein